MGAPQTITPCTNDRPDHPEAQAGADRKGAEFLLSGESPLLEMVARGCPLTEILTTLCRLIEELSAGSLCGILLVDSTGRRLEHGAAPSLPPKYNEAIQGRPANSSG